MCVFLTFYKLKLKNYVHREFDGLTKDNMNFLSVYSLAGVFRDAFSMTEIHDFSDFERAIFRADEQMYTEKSAKRPQR